MLLARKNGACVRFRPTGAPAWTTPPQPARSNASTKGRDARTITEKYQLRLGRTHATGIRFASKARSILYT